MSKKMNSSGVGKNTLFNYFARSPVSVEKKKIPKTPTTDIETKNNAEQEKENVKNDDIDLISSCKQKVQPAAKRKLETEPKPEANDEAGGDVIRQGKRNKRARIIVESDDDEEENANKKNTKHNKSQDDEYDPDGTMEVEEEEDEDEEDNNSGGDDFSASESDASISECETDDDDATNEKTTRATRKSTVKEKVRKRVPTATGATFAQKLEDIKQKAENDMKTQTKNSDKFEKIVCTTSTLDEPTIWPHQKLEFLKPENIKDKDGRRPDDPHYDASTLYVPPKFLDSLSPGVRQWWILKSNNFDCVLFFKVGKFYELYHMDADVGVNELGFTYMRGEFAHSGFPEISFDKMASILVDRGYKIARVEQTETPDMMTERCKLIKATKFDKVVRREICQITNRGTQVFNSQCQITPNHQPNYMLAVVEKDEGGTSKYGICYIDTSIGDFYIGEFDDDKNCSRLLTLLSHHKPVLVISEKGSLTERTQKIFRTVLSEAITEVLPSKGVQACSAEKTLKHMAEKYFAKINGDDNWPAVLHAMQDDSDHLGLTPKADSKLALKALGECLAYMDKCHVEEKVLPMARYHFYTPPDMLTDGEQKTSPQTNSGPRRGHMVLDYTTLLNLRVLGEEHSLLSTLDQCCTKFGKRLLHHWVCAPSCDLTVIEERQQAISELLGNPDILQEVRGLFAQVPDFERHLAQIHLFGNKQIVDNHPDGRAILFEERLYNGKKIRTFSSILSSFQLLTGLPKIFSNCKSPLLKRITQLPENGGIFPYMTELLEFFKNAFNNEQAFKTGIIAPEKGVDAEFDAAEAKIAEINKELKEYLQEQEKYFGCRLTYFGSDKKRFQLEVPESSARKAGSEYSLEGQKKGPKPCRRYSTYETKTFLKRMQSAEEERTVVLRDLARRIFEKFSQHYDIWKCCSDCVATLDVLSSLAEYARLQNNVCVPVLTLPLNGDEPRIALVEGYHPCLPAATFIPNSIVLGDNGYAPLSILTGPNMGGKSTLMREVGLLVIMAQIGALVPADSLHLTIVDRIFTRLGAQDDIIAGHSTFLVELNETSLILKHATRNSLVLLDELGRGTATYDGTAIAASVINYLGDLQCRTIFSTHYHNIIEFFNNDKRINLGHMACMVENEDTDDPTQETVTFLYKYTDGACPKSYGFNAAKLGGMPRPIIKRAHELSKKVEAIALKRKICSKIVTAAGGVVNINLLKNLLLQLRACQV